ncbi:MAG: DEAD/DEAH box helicase family protein, partial [Candidatus Sericytochromatia bacterium]|nr:DEAD/DEAH box helicase family protein [Candidatus Tanganyikabacteria bacterium]
MAAVLPRGDFFANPIVNPPYGAPRLHWELDAAGRPTMRILEGRRPGATPLVDRVRAEVARWRERGEAAMQQLTPVSARLLRHWKDHDFSGARPFWCQIEAAETAIWLREAASHDKRGRALLAEIAAAGDAGGGLSRLAFKMATGAGKTTVMAMLIAWQTLNAVRNPADKRFARGFLVVTPGLTIRERLRVLQPHDPDSWYASRELLPPDMLADLGKAKIVIVNFHAFLPRERLAVSRGGRSLLEGRTGPALDLRESEGRMMRRVMPELAGLDRVVVLNDEGHHCYRVRASAEALFAPEDAGSGARVETESARMWISGLEAVARHFEVVRVFDLSATPYYPQGSGYREGSLFPWTVADFPLLEAIECGIVKLPRVPKDCAGILVQPAAGRRRREPAVSGALASALMTLYRLYEQTFLLWEEVGMPAPPCFIVVCNDTVTSKLVYDYISAPGSPLELFRNFAAGGVPVDRPCTLLVDSRQLEADEDRSQQIRAIANSVGKPGKPGAGVRCVVSVAMLSEGWDASTVTHVLGVRAFGTQWLCEQVVGRALRRQSYEVDARGMLAPEFADVAGIPFDFAAEPVVAAPQRPRRAVSVHAVRPDRDALEIRFPRVEGYQLELPAERLRARFGPECGLVLTPEMAASPAGSRGLRTAAVASHLARELIVR